MTFIRFIVRARLYDLGITPRYVLTYQVGTYSPGSLRTVRKSDIPQVLLVVGLGSSTAAIKATRGFDPDNGKTLQATSPNFVRHSASYASGLGVGFSPLPAIQTFSEMFSNLWVRMYRIASLVVRGSGMRCELRIRPLLCPCMSLLQVKVESVGCIMPDVVHYDDEGRSDLILLGRLIGLIDSKKKKVPHN